MSTVAELSTKDEPTLCPGCGDFGILTAVKQAIAEVNIPREQMLIVSGIGCGSKIPHFIKTYGFEGLHGRGLAVATGAKLANPDLKVIAIGGDGDSYGIGGNHFLHTMRRNLDITLIVENNAVYGLTKGQVSPTARKGQKSPSTPSGVIEEPMNPLLLAIAAGATFVARGYAFDMPHLKKLMIDAINHKGFALIDIFQPCPTYNKENTMVWFKQKLYKLDANHNPADKLAAMQRSMEWGDKIPYGLFYHEEGKFTYDDDVQKLIAPPIKQAISDARGNSVVDLSPILARFQ